MNNRYLFTLSVFAGALIGTVAYAQGHVNSRASTPTTYDTTLQKAFECRSVASNIDLALRTRHIAPDGQTHTTLTPPLFVLGFKVSDVTVFRDSGEDVYAVYLKDQGAAVAVALKKATWPGAAGFSAASVPGGMTRLACSISPGPAGSGDGDD